MKLLVVEDKLDEVAVIKEFTDSQKEIESYYVTNRDDALELLSENFFDLIVLDLQIPPSKTNLTPEVDHGMVIVENLRENHSTTPVIFFSAFGTQDRVRDLLEKNDRSDFFGTGEREPLLEFCRKSELDRCIESVKEFTEKIQVLEQTIIDGEIDGLTEIEKRVIRLFARQSNGSKVQVKRLGGQSATKTLRLIVKDDEDNVRCLAVGKIGDRSKVDDELSNFQSVINPLLPPTTFAPHIRSVSAGARNMAGNFFGLAAQYNTSLYQLVKEDQERACEVVNQLKDYERIWLGDMPRRKLSVRDVRSNLIRDEQLEPHLNFLGKDLITSFEANVVDLIWIPQHGDLHGFNVLIDDTNRPIFIDYGESRLAPGALDPVLLELCLVFHTDAEFIREGWNYKLYSENWSNLDSCTNGNPYNDYIRACRSWSCDPQRDDLIGALVVAYSFAVRQMKFADTNKDAAKAIVLSVIDEANRQGNSRKES